MQRSHGTHISIRPLPRTFYERDTVRVAKDLLGKVLVRRLGSSTLTGTIVETEAYRGYDDPASHAYRGPTSRNLVMFGEAGHAYVYFTYGMHYCLNVTTERIGRPAAVLIRAVQPVRGIERMKKHRRMGRIEDLANGPAKLTQAFAITSALNGHDLTTGRRLFIVKDNTHQAFEIESTSRIGVVSGKEKPWRFFIKGNAFVSKQ
jgi:DNA-3-methyladenine glycosylase